MEIRHGNPPWLARVSLNNRKRAQLRFGHYFKHHRLALEQNKLAIHIEIKNASTPTQIVSCQLTSLSAKATATMAKKAEIDRTSCRSEIRQAVQCRLFVFPDE